MKRTWVSFIRSAGLVVVALLAGILVVQWQQGSSSGASATAQRGAAPVITQLAATPTQLAAAATPSLQAVGSPTVSDHVNQVVLDYLAATGSIRSGQPQIIYSRPVTQRQLFETNLARIRWSPDCNRPLYLVIVHGDFDISMLAPGFGGQTEPKPFIGFVYDLEAETFAQIMPSRNGAIFKAALEDPSLPDPSLGEIQLPQEGSGWLECETQLPTDGPSATPTSP